MAWLPASRSESGHRFRDHGWIPRSLPALRTADVTDTPVVLRQSERHIGPGARISSTDSGGTSATAARGRTTIVLSTGVPASQDLPDGRSGFVRYRLLIACSPFVIFEVGRFGRVSHLHCTHLSECRQIPHFEH